jgi:hypothetical protein
MLVRFYFVHSVIGFLYMLYMWTMVLSRQSGSEARVEGKMRAGDIAAVCDAEFGTCG